MKQIVFSEDALGMNWLRPDYPYGEVRATKELYITKKDYQDQDYTRTEIIIENQSDKPLFTSLGDIQITFPLEDRYEGSQICLTQRCHTHIFCGGQISYMIALRMGGMPPHLGMVLLEGSLGGYSVERDINKMSNDRGCFLLQPSPMEILPGEKKKISWMIFPHSGKEDFYKKAAQFRKFVQVKADRYVFFQGEPVKLQIKPSFSVESVRIGNTIIKGDNGIFNVEYQPISLGEKKIDLCVEGIHTWCSVFVQKKIDGLAKERCMFLVKKQQYQGSYKNLKGAYLVFDNEENHVFYSTLYDYNGGRERVGMGLLMAKYLQQKEKKLEEKDFHIMHNSLKQFLEFVQRELVDSITGEVYNDIQRDDHYERLYNRPWYALLFTEAYRLYGEKEYLQIAVRILQKFYEKGGIGFYAIEIPILDVYDCLEREGMKEECVRLKGLFENHGEKILEKGLDYPPLEVNFEQSIVAPAASILFQLYLLTGKEKYRQGGEEQLRILELFNGSQPDYHLYETAIRHWDGYWFGKRRLYGDTFPHYWSALTGEVYGLYYQITEKEEYRKKAQASIRGVLPLFFEDGRASCAYLYPCSINGRKGKFFDEYANDQDWGLYLNLKWEKILKGKEAEEK